MLARDKHTSVLRTLINYELNKFDNKHWAQGSILGVLSNVGMVGQCTWKVSATLL